MAGPDFTDLGVTDPTTGKPVYLTPQNMATVLGATGGVAPTQFQAGVEGAFKGIQQGQNIVTNFQEQAINQQQIDANEIRNDIARQTKDATILARNNQVKQQAIQMQMQTESLTNENSILSAIHSGDANQLITAISDPKLITEAIKYNPEIEAVAAKLQSSNSFTPEQLSKLNVFRTTNSIYKNGDLQSQYNNAGKAVAGLPEVQQLQQISGIPMDQLLAQMTTGQSQPGIDPITGQRNMSTGGTVLVSPTGHKVLLPEKDNDTTSKLLPPFFSARQQVSSPGPLKLPQSFGPVPKSETTSATEVPATTEAAPAALPNAQTAAPTPPSAPVQAQPQQAAPQVNPNNVSPTGQVLQSSVPQLAPLNSVTTVLGDSLTANAMRQAQTLVAQGVEPKDAMAQGLTIATKATDVAQKAKVGVATDTKISDDFKSMAIKIRSAVALADKTGYEFGSSAIPSIPGVFNTEGTPNIRKKVTAAFSADTRQDINNIEGPIKAAAGQWGFALMSKDSIKAGVSNSDAERAYLQATGPSLTISRDQLLSLATVMESYSDKASDQATLRNFLALSGRDVSATDTLIAEYNQAYPSLIPNEQGFYEPNPERLKNPPLKWLGQKEGFLDAATLDAFKTPTTKVTVPGVQNPEAAGSGTSQPFSPAQKTPASAFPQAPVAKDVRGGNYDTTPASQKDIHAIADTAASGGNIRQFQTGSSVPRKLDKATPDLMARLVGAESSGNINAVSPIKRDANGKIVSGGVEGLAQVTNATFKEVAPEAQKEFQTQLVNRKDPRQSLAAGTAYMNKMLKRYDGNVDFALAAYNAGPKEVDDAIEASGASVARGGIDQIAPYLPKTQPTGAYVKRITSRGRVSAEQEKQKGGGFFNDFSINQLNPFAASTAEAEEPTPSKDPTLAAVDTYFAGRPKNQPVTQEDISGFMKANPGMKKEDVLAVLESTFKGTPTDAGTDIETQSGVPTIDPSQIPSTESKVEVPKMDTAPRGDVPPVSEIQAAFKKEMGFQTAPFGNVGRAVDFVRNSALGKWMGDRQGDTWFKSGENIINAATFGLYDDGMDIIIDDIGLDGDLVQKEIRDSLKDFRKEKPGLAFATDIFGSVVGGAGANMMLRALKGVAAASVAESFAPMTIKSGVSQGAAQGAARSGGESEGGAENALGNIIVGGAVGAVTGGGLGAAGRIPKVGAPAVAGAGLGAIAGGTGGLETMGVPAGPEGVVSGAGMGAGLAVTGRLTPLVTKAITSAVVKLNNRIGTNIFGAMAQKIMTSKTPQEAANNLTPLETMMAQQTAYLSDAEKRAILKDFQEAANKGVPVGAVDFLPTTKFKHFTRVLSWISKDPESNDKVMKKLAERGTAGATERIEANLGQSTVEQTARRIIALIPSKKIENQRIATNVTRGIYANAKNKGDFKSPVIDELLTVPEIKRAVSMAKENIKAPISKPEMQQKLSDQMVDRIEKGMTVDDLLTLNHNELADNNYEVLTTARRILRDEIAEEAPNARVKSQLIEKSNLLNEEMKNLNDDYRTADAVYEVIKSRVDFLKNDQIKAIEGLANGKVELAIGKLLDMSPTDLQSTMKILGPLGDVGEAFIKNKLNSARQTGDIASKLWTPKQWTNLEIMLGKGRANALKAVADTESRLAKTNRELAPGSSTIPNRNAEQEVMDMAGASDEPFHTASQVVAGSFRQTIARGLSAFFRTFHKEPDPKVLNDIAETFFLSSEKGIASWNKVLKAHGLEKAEIDALQSQLKIWHDIAQGGGQGIPTSLQGQDVQPKNKSKKKNK